MPSRTAGRAIGRKRPHLHARQCAADDRPWISFEQGQAEIDSRSTSPRNAETGALEDFTCDGAECSADCMPDAVTVRITNYQFRRF